MSYTGSAQLELGTGITTPLAVCVIRIQRGNQGDMIGRTSTGKIVIFTCQKPVEGYALAHITEEREKVAFGQLATLAYRDPSDKPDAWVANLQGVLVNGPAASAEDFLTQVNESIATSVARRLAERQAAEDERAMNASRHERQLEMGRDYAGDNGEALVRALQKHDWYYNSSDCARTWRQGKEESDSIKELIAKMDLSTARILWSEIAPSGFAMPRPNPLTFEYYAGCHETGDEATPGKWDDGIFTALDGSKWRIDPDEEGDHQGSSGVHYLIPT